MDIHQITDRLNELASTSPSLKNLQIIRAGKRPSGRARTYNIFSKSTVFDGDYPYAFHDGGRSEIQFNIGKEELEDGEIFRYGLGFSLEPNQSQPDPINFLTPKIYAFNQFVKIDSTLLQGLYLWHYAPDGIRARTPDFPVAEIPQEWIEWNNFIFIGHYLKKKMNDINEGDLVKIISLFDKLMPVYEYVENESSKFKLPSDGEKISRICWNTNGWIRPSGPKGKSKNKGSHEALYGYGHEEWLCDISKLLDGYHYGFLESIRGMEANTAGRKYNIELFSIDGESGNRYAVGKIYGAEIIDAETAASIKREYEQRGWLKEMENQIIKADAKNSGFSEWPGLNLFNVRFRLADLQMFGNYRLVKDNKIIDASRYELMRKTGEITLQHPIVATMTFNPDPEKEADSDGEVESNTYDREPGPVEIRYLHKKISKGLKNHLIDEYGYCVGKECHTGQGTLVDLVREKNGNRIFYEIKAYNSIKICIREALGQLLEYSYWPDNENAKAMIIVGIIRMDEESRLYLKKLRQNYKLPIYYQQFDIEASKLIDGDFSDEELVLN